ncbi:MAG: TlpA family protein disulfide reductase [Bdellovibrionales bacterium]|nr:TlpA family protein disulfide reductase [Bdellovibrionales bacterium]
MAYAEPSKVKKTILNRLFDSLAWLLVLVLLFWQAPRWWKTYQRQGMPLNQVEVYAFDGDPLLLPQIGGKSILVFWASWCGPCQAQLSMLSNAYKNGDFQKEAIYLVNLGEDKKIVESYLKENPSPFRIYLSRDSSAWKEFEVLATPTILFILPNGVIDYATTGLSPLLNYRIKSFLK